MPYWCSGCTSPCQGDGMGSIPVYGSTVHWSSGNSPDSQSGERRFESGMDHVSSGVRRWPSQLVASLLGRLRVGWAWWSRLAVNQLLRHGRFDSCPAHLEIKKLNMDMFHPMDHWPFTKECASWYGGWRNHLGLVWEYRAKPWLATQTSCRVGWHKKAKGSRPGMERTVVVCWFCWKTLEGDSGRED